MLKDIDTTGEEEQDIGVLASCGRHKRAARWIIRSQANAHISPVHIFFGNCALRTGYSLELYEILFDCRLRRGSNGHGALS